MFIHKITYYHNCMQGIIQAQNKLFTVTTLHYILAHHLAVPSLDISSFVTCGVVHDFETIFVPVATRCRETR